MSELKHIGRNDKPIYPISRDIAKCYPKLPEKYIYSKLAESDVHIPIVIDRVNFLREICGSFRDNAMEESGLPFCADSSPAANDRQISKRINGSSRKKARDAFDLYYARALAYSYLKERLKEFESTKG